MKLLASLSLKSKIIAAATATALVAGTVAIAVVISNMPEAFRLLKIFEMTGTSVVTRADTGTIDAYTGMNLESGDVIEVGAESTMMLSLDNDKYLSLDPSTVLELIAEGTETDNKTTVNLRSGGVLNEITEPLSDDSSYSVNTPKATMAVRGTSFYVSVRALDDGSYITDMSVFHGKVSVQLIDEAGNPKGEPVIVEPNESIAILTVPFEDNITGAELNGTSYFILRKNDGSDIFSVVKDGDDPVMPLNCMIIPRNVLERVISTHDNTDIILSEAVLRAILGEDILSASSETTAVINSDETTAPETTSEIASETTFPVSEAEETLIPSEITTVPVTEAETTATANATATAVTTTVTTVETTAETTVTTEAETASDTEKATATTKEPPAVTIVQTTTEADEEEQEEETCLITFVSSPGQFKVAADQVVKKGDPINSPSFSPQITYNGVNYVLWGLANPLPEYAESDMTVTVIYVEAGTVFTVTVTDNGTQISSISGTYSKGDVFVLPAPTGSTNDMAFKYWGRMGISSGGIISQRGSYNAGDTVTVDSYIEYYYEDDTNDTTIVIDAIYTPFITVTFLDHEGNTISSVTSYDSGSIALPDAPYREGYTFDHWIASDGYSFNGSVRGTADITVTPYYIGNPITVSYVYNGITYDTYDSLVGNSYFIPGFNAAAAGIYDGNYTFNYYVDDYGNMYTIGDSIILTENMTLTAVVTF